MNCILLDDERPALELLEDNVKKIPYLNIVASCRNPMQAVELMKENQVDLMFLDVQMPILNGLELLRSLKNPPMVILVTAFEEHALAGFDLDVVDYLVKPVPFARFLKAVEKAYVLYRAKQLHSKTNALESDYVFVNANYSLVKIRIQDITYIEGLKDYVRINMINGKLIVTRMGLKSIEDRLHSESFMRIHKSYIVALDKIESIQKTNLVIAGQELPIGDAYRQCFQEYISGKNL